MRFFITTEDVSNGPGFWNSLSVSIFLDKEDGSETSKIGEYVRNYSCMYDTFLPFEKDGKWYALYSEDYTATSVMTLPDCKKIASETPQGMGFCPVAFYVPNQIYCQTQSNGQTQEKTYVSAPGFSGQYAFVSGCYWGDDTSWKVQLLDLTKLEEGIILREDPFDYHSLPHDVELKDAFLHLELELSESGEPTLVAEVKTSQKFYSCSLKRGIDT